MKEVKSFFCMLFGMFIALFIYHLDKKYGIHFDDNYRQIFKIGMPVAAEFLFIFVYSIIANRIDKQN